MSAKLVLGLLASAALLLVAVVLRGLLKGYWVGNSLIAGLVVIGVDVSMLVGLLVWSRYGDSEREGELPEPKEGISRWTPR